MDRRARTLGRTLGRIGVGLLLFWGFTPILVIIGFLGWATVTAEGVWQIVFGVCTLAIVAAMVRWIRGLMARRSRKAATRSVASPARTSAFGDSLGGFEPQI